MKQLFITLLLVCISLTAPAQNVSVHASNQPAATVFRSIIEQTGMNFVYASDILKDVKVSVSADRKPLKAVLNNMFKDTDIEYKIKGKNIILKQKETKATRKEVERLNSKSQVKFVAQPHASSDSITLREVVVTSRLEAPVVETAEIGAKKITADEVRNVPTLFGERDVIRALQTQPGVTEGTEGMAGMYVHGGDNDENMYMLDNVPLYQVNHFAGLFSAFNTDCIRYIDFFKSSIPAKYDGRLSSFMDVRTINGNTEGHHGSARLGLTSGAFNISGPIGKRTTYMLGLRRSWYDVLSVPMMAIANSGSDEKTRLQYYFMDLNAKVTHRFNNNTTAFVSVYFGDDLLKTGDEDKDTGQTGWLYKDKYDFHWGNLLAQAGVNHRINPNLSSEFTAGYTRYFTSMKYDETTTVRFPTDTTTTHQLTKTNNNINDWIFRGDFRWEPLENSTVRFGAKYIHHSFLPSRTTRDYAYNADKLTSRDSTWAYRIEEASAYIEDDWRINSKWHVNAGLHASIYVNDGVKHSFAPRLSLSYRPSENVALKAAYSRTSQIVHQLTQTYLALPTDQWVPVTGNFKPQTSDKVAVGGYWQLPNRQYTLSVEGYYKWMHNLIDYCDEYYLKPPIESWNARLTSGKGTAKGIDIKFEKTMGSVTGHVSYSLAWTDRTFAEKNGGETYPARFDNRHTINVLVNWQVSKRVQLNASWTGHSGNRFTLLPQVWEQPTFGNPYYSYFESSVPQKASLNNYQLPFYHRLDLSCNVNNKRGYWTFGLYNAYCHMNTMAIRTAYTEEYPQRPIFQKVKLLPVIPSVSYTWIF
jgi:hypothetical protein